MNRFYIHFEEFQKNSLRRAFWVLSKTIYGFALCSCILIKPFAIKSYDFIAAVTSV